MLTFTRPAYDQQAVFSLIVPKEVVEEDDSDGFFSALGDVFSEYMGLASFFSMFMLIAAVGLGYLIRSSRIDEPKVLISSTMDAELMND
jgi:hypothetical protein